MAIMKGMGLGASFARSSLKLTVLSSSACRRIHGPPLPSDADLFDAVAQYPDILKFRNKDEKEEAALVEKVRKMPTVEEKQVYVNLPKILGWKTAMLSTSYIPPTALNSIQYLTNTTVVEAGKLPDVYNEDQELAKEAAMQAEVLEPLIKNFIAFHLTQVQLGFDVPNDKVMYREPFALNCGIRIAKVRRNLPLISGLNRIIMGRLSHLKDHLKTASVDYAPRNEAFWFRGHVDPEWGLVCKKRGTFLWQRKRNFGRMKEEDVEAQVDHAVQIMCEDTHLQLRCTKALTPFVGFDDPLVVKGHVPDSGYLPKYLGWPKKRRYGTNLLGTWTSTGTPFGHLSFIDSINKYDKLTSETSWSESSEHNERPDLLLGKLVMSGFATTMAQACNQGFSPFNDPSRPFVSQVGVTDGRRFKLGIYQLNKTAMQGISETNEEMRRNVCWYLEEQELFERVTDSGEVVGFNKDLLTTLLKLYLVEPVTAEAELPNREYLGGEKNKRHLYQVENTLNREGLHQNHRFLYSNRPRDTHAARYDEILAYQKLWMIRHPRVWKPFSMREHPWFRMKNLCFKGREHWDPEFRWFDNQPGRRLLAKERGPRGSGKFNRTPKRLPFVTAPLPPDDEEE